MWDLQDLDPLETWTKGRALLVGDAAHGMTPLQGQGANQSIEDAGALRLLLDPEVRKQDMPSILEKVEAERKPRATQVLMDTRALAQRFSIDAISANMDYNFRSTEA